MLKRESPVISTSNLAAFTGGRHFKVANEQNRINTTESVTTRNRSEDIVVSGEVQR